MNRFICIGLLALAQIAGVQNTATLKDLPVQTATLTPQCADVTRQQNWSSERFDIGSRSESTTYSVECFPGYVFKNDGYFLASTRQPLPTMGQTCGAFNVLWVFVDNAANRAALLNNPSLTARARRLVTSGDVVGGLRDLVGSWSRADLTLRIQPQPPIQFKFDYMVSAHGFDQLSQVVVPRPAGARFDRYVAANEGTAFSKYDAVVVVESLPAAGYGVRRFPPGNHVFFNTGATFTLRLQPQSLTPGLFFNEMLRRNVPVLLFEYTFGADKLEKTGAVTYDVTPIINPRTGENIEPLIRASAAKTPLYYYIAGYADIDRDGRMDCVDPSIRATADNVDADFIPDRYDPDLTVNHTPFFWKR